MRVRYFLLTILIFVLTINDAGAQNCANTSVGFPPITDLGQSLWRGLQGGLYPGGQNTPPFDHNAAALDISGQIAPLDSNGDPDAGGKIVLLSIGMSNTSLEFEQFLSVTDTVQSLNPALAIVNGAQGGHSIDDINDPSTDYWDVINDRLNSEGLSRFQVQGIWFKQAERKPQDTTLAHIDVLKEKYKTAVLISKAQFPNLKIAYLSSRIYAGYAASDLNPEPFAYYSGWSIKRLIEAQINGDADLVFEGTNAPAPLLLWGPYIWADGLTPRGDGLTWACDEFRDDGTHPSSAGRQKVAGLLLDFFKNDSTTQSWFLNPTIATGIADASGTPEKFVLNQNYPNPFNPTTQIPFTLPQTGQVKIDIYTSVGQKVATVLNEQKTAGRHAVTFDASFDGALASGVYYYRIAFKATGNARHFQATKKMLLVK